MSWLSEMVINLSAEVLIENWLVIQFREICNSGIDNPTDPPWKKLTRSSNHCSITELGVLVSDRSETRRSGAGVKARKGVGLGRTGPSTFGSDQPCLKWVGLLLARY